MTPLGTQVSPMAKLTGRNRAPDLGAPHNDVDSNVYIGGTGLQTNPFGFLKENDNVTYWNAIANVTLQKNVQLHAEYAFDVDDEKATNEDDLRAVS